MPEFDQVKDSGARAEFSTGSVRDTAIGKGRYDLLPFLAIKRVAKHYENGAIKYVERNWEKGQPVPRMLDSAMRHLAQAMAGMQDEDHLAAAAWNILGVIEFEERIEIGMDEYKPMFEGMGPLWEHNRLKP